VNAFALHDVSDQAVFRRWGVSAAAILTAHAALIANRLKWDRDPAEPRALRGFSFIALDFDCIENARNRFVRSVSLRTSCLRLKESGTLIALWHDGFNGESG